MKRAVSGEVIVALADRLTRAEQMARAGNGKLVPEPVVGKALGSLDSGTGVIEVLVTLQ
jgi:hypothetical protein